MQRHASTARKSKIPSVRTRSPLTVPRSGLVSSSATLASPSGRQLLTALDDTTAPATAATLRSSPSSSAQPFTSSPSGDHLLQTGDEPDVEIPGSDANPMGDAKPDATAPATQPTLPFSQMWGQQAENSTSQFTQADFQLLQTKLCQVTSSTYQLGPRSVIIFQ